MSGTGRLSICFLAHQTGRRENGGLESLTQILEHATRVNAVVVTNIESPFNDRWRSAGAEVQVWETGGSQRAVRALKTVASNLRMRRFARSRGFDLVHCNDIQSLWAGGPGCKAAGVPLVFNVRAVKSAGEPYGWKWRAARLSTRIIVLSEEMRRALQERLPIGQRHREAIESIYSAVDLDEFAPPVPSHRAEARRRLGIEGDRIAIVYAAAFKPVKAQLRLIQRLGPHLRDRLPDARLYLVGDFRPEQDPYARQCRDAVRELGLEDTFVFAGYSNAVSDWYRAADLSVVASEREGLARCMAESLACGTPVISFAVSSAREILEGNACGAVVAQGDYAGMAEEIERLAGDPRLLAEYARNARRTAERLFEPGIVVREYERVWSEVAGRIQVAGIPAPRAAESTGRAEQRH